MTFFYNIGIIWIKMKWPMFLKIPSITNHAVYILAFLSTLSQSLPTLMNLNLSLCSNLGSLVTHSSIWPYGHLREMCACLTTITGQFIGTINFPSGLIEVHTHNDMPNLHNLLSFRTIHDNVYRWSLDINYNYIFSY